MKNEIITDVAIIGGGASGLIAAISASYEFEANNMNGKVIILEHCSRVGRKILATGNGKCNLTNINAINGHYYGEEKQIISSVLTRFPSKFIMEFFSRLGMLYKIDLEGRVYPLSEQASTVLDLLRLEINRMGIVEMCDFNILNIIKSSHGFVIKSKDQVIKTKKIIMATGGKASPTLGSDGSGYKYMESLGHTVLNVFPSLVQVRVKDDIIRSLKGVRANCFVSINAGGKILKKEHGEIQFTDNGLSGICVFQVSRLVSEYFCSKKIFGTNYKSINIIIDLMPKYNKEFIINAIKKRVDFNPNLVLDELFTGILNKRINQAILKYCNIVPNSRKIKSLSKKEIELLASTIKHWAFTPVGTMPWQNAQVTAGGVSAFEFNKDTLESKITPGLFAAGELLDVDGECGGFNLQWAWSSGYLAGKSAAEQCINKK